MENILLNITSLQNFGVINLREKEIGIFSL